MSRVEEIWDQLQAGELDRATELTETLREEAPDVPDVVAVSGAILAARGQIDAALAELMHAFEISPEGHGARHLLDAAELELYALDDPETAASLCAQALDITADDDEFIDAVLMHTEALIAMGERDDEARAMLGELEGSSIDDPAVACRIGDLYAAIGSWDEAEAAFRAAIEIEPDWADAYHGLGGVYEAQERDDDMVKAWLRVLELDAAAPDPEWSLQASELESVVDDALGELPEDVRKRLTNVPIFIEDAPSEEMVREGHDPRLLGLFSGVPLPEQAHGTDGYMPSIEAIHVFQRNLERVSQSHEHLLHELRITVLHETAHFFGLDEEDLDDLGLG